MGRRVEDGGRSECPPVAGGIGVESSGEITPRESGPTSLWSFVTRASEPLSGGKQMTADLPAGAASGVFRSSAPDQYRAGGALVSHRVPQGTLREA